MSGPEHPARGREPAGDPDAVRAGGAPLPARAGGRSGRISRGLNQRSEFVQELQRHAEAHRNRLPAPDGQAGSGSTPP